MPPGLNTPRLFTQLLNTGLQTKDNPLYQVIYSLIGGLAAVQNAASASSDVITGLVFTPGSIIYAGADGKLTQLNASLFFDYTNIRVGIGTNAPTNVLVAQQNGTGDALIQIKRSSGTTSDWTIGSITADAGLSLLSSGVSKATLSTAGLLDTTTLQATQTALALTSTDGIIARNTTPATSGVTVQISPRIKLRGTAWDTSASQTIDFILETLPTTAATPRGDFKIGFSRNAGTVTYPLILSAGSANGGALLTLPSAAGNLSAFRGGDGSASSPVFGTVHSSGGSAIGFWFPAANDMDLVCGGANQILWGVGLWRNSSALSIGWSSTSDPNSAVADTALIRHAAAKIRFTNKPETTPDAGFVLDFSTDVVAKFRNRADSAFATVDCLDIKTENATFIHRTGIALTNNAAANVATLNNGPTAGDPTKWIAIDDNGTTRFIPAW